MVWWWLLTGCVSSPTGGLLEPTASAARSRAFTVASSPVAPGIDWTLSVGPLAPGEEVHLAGSTQGRGAGPCPPSLGGTCLQLTSVTYLGSAVADWSGRATLHTTAPPLAGGATTMWVQAVVVDAAGVVHLIEPREQAVHDAAEVHLGDLVVGDSADLPVAREVIAVQGDLRVEGTDLEEVELLSLVEVGGDVVVWENDALELLRAPALVSVGGDLSLYDAPALERLDDWGALQRVGGTLSLNRLVALEQLQLPALEQVGALYAFHDPLLTDLDGLSSLQGVAGAAQLWELYGLTRLSLPALQSVGGALDLFAADALVELSLPALTTVGTLEVHACDALVELGDLSALETVHQGLRLRYLEGLASVDGLSALLSAGSVTVEHTPALQALPLPALHTVSGRVEVSRTGAEELGLWGLVEAGSVELRSNGALVDLGMESLAEVGAVTVVGNPALSQCAVEGWLDALSHGVVACGGNLDDGCTSVCVGSP
jgi:hypothetical protein